MTKDLIGLLIAFGRLVVTTFGFEMRKNKLMELFGMGTDLIIRISPVKLAV